MQQPAGVGPCKRCKSRDPANLSLRRSVARPAALLAPTPTRSHKVAYCWRRGAPCDHNATHQSAARLPSAAGPAPLTHAAARQDVEAQQLAGVVGDDHQAQVVGEHVHRVVAGDWGGGVAGGAWGWAGTGRAAGRGGQEGMCER